MIGDDILDFVSRELRLVIEADVGYYSLLQQKEVMN
ncbi:MAG: endonuclease domain-containing protein [Bacteroidales bacterium]|nr:endonuclease domain-containing protein [Bacteroidales bacterium]